MADPRTAAGPRENTSSPNQRETFLEVREILKRVLEALREVRRHLAMVEVSDERTRLFVETLLRQRGDLENAIDQCMLDAPAGVLDGFVQYGASPSVGTAEPPADARAEPLARWQTEVDEAIAACLHGLAQRLEERPDAAELVDSVARLLAAHDRRVALELQELHDV